MVMKLPKLKTGQEYAGLYVIDFGEHTAVGFTAQETAEILESERYKDCKVYKIHKAYPDGRMELKGVNSEIFQLEAGMFFYSTDLEDARRNFEQLVKLAVKTPPPARAKVHLAKYSDAKFATAIIHPAEYDDELSQWLLDGGYMTQGTAEGGIGAVGKYYDDKPQILERHQLFAAEAIESRTGEQLLANIKLAVQR